jgi:hypothetical protein
MTLPHRHRAQKSRLVLCAVRLRRTAVWQEATRVCKSRLTAAAVEVEAALLLALVVVVVVVVAVVAVVSLRMCAQPTK